MSQQPEDTQPSAIILHTPRIIGLALIIISLVLIPVMNTVCANNPCSGSSVGILASYRALVFFVVCPGLIGLGISLLLTGKFTSVWNFRALILPAMLGFFALSLFGV